MNRDDIEPKVEEFWLDKLERAIGALESGKAERERLEAAVKEERGRHEETNKARLKALAVNQEQVLSALTSALDGERKAREAAEARAKEQHRVIVENKLPEKQPQSWRIEVVKRDANGFVVAMEATPKHG